LDGRTGSQDTMGLIKKKTAVRTTEGGIKYICDICSVDITATVRLPLQPLVARARDIVD